MKPTLFAYLLLAALVAFASAQEYDAAAEPHEYPDTYIRLERSPLPLYTPPEGETDLLDIMNGIGCSRFAAGMARAGFTKVLEGMNNDNITVFCPTDDAIGYQLENLEGDTLSFAVGNMIIPNRILPLFSGQQGYTTTGFGLMIFDQLNEGTWYAFLTGTSAISPISIWANASSNGNVYVLSKRPLALFEGPLQPYS